MVSPNLFNYIDDLIYMGLTSDVHSAFHFLKDLLAELGLHISFKKLVPPSTSVVCLGILVELISNPASISTDRVRFPAQPQVGKLVVACCWSAVYSTEP